MRDEEKQENYQLAEKLLSEQSFAAAIVGGAVAAVLASAAYGIVAALWPYSYGFAAAGVGTAIGLSMGFLGRGISPKFAVTATLYTIAGCMLGNFFRAIVELARLTANSPVDVLRDNALSVLAERAMSAASPVDLVFWFVAVFCAVFLARRPLSRSERLAIGLYQLRD